MEASRLLYVADRASWRAWLSEHHATEQEIWLVFYKAHTGRPMVLYGDVVEEALCFGWIDSIVHRLDDERYARKFTPRRSDSKWSDLNKRRVRKLIREGRMTKAGLATITFNLNDVDENPPPRSPREKPELPVWMQQALEANPAAWGNFNLLPPSHQRNYIGWVCSAKKEETRQRRIQEAIELLEKNQRLGLK